MQKQALSKEEKILGGFLGAAAGDAMGAATETRSIDDIREKFGGYVKTFLTPPDDVFAAGRSAGSVTDDFSLIKHLAEALIKSGGAVTDAVAEEAVLTWYDEGTYLAMVGPSIVECVARLRNMPFEKRYPNITIDNFATTNGSGMRILPVGLLSGGDIDKAIGDAVVICRPTHNNISSMSGGCAVAAGVAAAMRENATSLSIVEAGLKGARYGEKIGAHVAVPSVYRRISLAVEIGLRSDDFERTIYDLNALIGTGLSAYQSIPAAFGIVAASKGDAMTGLFMGVNAGDDADTVACMVGSMLGTLQGAGAYPAEYIDVIDRANDYDIRGLAKRFSAIVK